MNNPLLFKQYPALKYSVPWVSLGNFPTPIKRLNHLSDDLDNEIYIKQEDIGGEYYGGNKVRKLEYVLGYAKLNKYQSIVTYGASGSNWVVATVIYGKMLGMNVSALLFHRPLNQWTQKNFDFIQQNADKVYNYSSVAMTGYYLLKARAQQSNKKVYSIGMGGSTPVSSFGYINWVMELKEQIDQGLIPEPEYIILAGGTGGTAAGMIAGISLIGLKSKIVIVRVTDYILCNCPRFNACIHRILKNLRKKSKQKISHQNFKDSYLILHSEIGKGYAIPTDKGKQAMELFKDKEGIELDPTYTAKAAAGLLTFIKENQLKDKSILFVNTYNSIDLNKAGVFFQNKAQPSQAGV